MEPFRERSCSPPSIATPHVAVIPWPGQGHINPMMHLSQKLASKGSVITFVNTQHNHLRMLQSTAAKSKLPTLQDQGVDIRLVGIPDGLPPNHPRTANILELCQAIVKMAPVFEELIEQLMHEEPPITCIISDVFMLFTQDVANKFGIPRVAFWSQSAASFAAHLLTGRGIRQAQAGNRQTLESAGVLSEISNLITGMPGSPPLPATDIPGFLHPFDPSDFLCDFLTRPLLQIDESDWILMNTFDELEATALVALRKQQKKEIYTVGPVLPTDFLTGGSFATKNGAVGLWPEEYSCLDWLDKQAPHSVLYIAFGSIAVLDCQQVQEIALALEACQQSLLWVVRPDLMCGESAIFPEGFVERMGSQALFISWAPQLQVLSHSSVGGFLTHCGWNSTLESISRGVPMLCWPYFADQMLNCRCIVEWWKIGLSLREDDKEVVSREEVVRKVRALMGEEVGSVLRRRTEELKEAIRRAIGEGGSTVNDFDLVIDNLMKQVRKKKLADEMGSLHF